MFKILEVRTLVLVYASYFKSLLSSVIIYVAVKIVCRMFAQFLILPSCCIIVTMHGLFALYECRRRRVNNRNNI
jgi:hypothetical protein